MLLKKGINTIKMIEIKKLFIILIIIINLSSCSVHNRMTSPVVLDKKERIWTSGLSIDPSAFSELGYISSPLAFIQPTIGYRNGIGRNQEIGFTLYGLTGPSIVIDNKHLLLKNGGFLLSGDIAFFAGAIRPLGLQYDLIFGNRKLYGTLGLGYDFLDLTLETPYLSIGIGSERILNKPFGFQISYGIGIPNRYNDIEHMLSIGIKFDFLKLKKKYRNQAETPSWLKTL